jgi:hypothetical protein
VAAGLVEAGGRGGRLFFRLRQFSKDAIAKYIWWLQQYACFPFDVWFERECDPLGAWPSDTEAWTRTSTPRGRVRLKNGTRTSTPPRTRTSDSPSKTRASRGDSPSKEGADPQEYESGKERVSTTHTIRTDREGAPQGELTGDGRTNPQPIVTGAKPTSTDPTTGTTGVGVLAPVDRCPHCGSGQIIESDGAYSCGRCHAHIRDLTAAELGLAD